jgi:Fe-S-cluster containining protein
MAAVRVLSFHAHYRCRHAGACCTANWPIPVEADRLSEIQAAMATDRLRPAAATIADAFNAPSAAPAETPALLGRRDHACVFYERNAVAGAGHCRIQLALGHEGLPLACRQFPRVSVHDPRGVSVTLSHYCPTAAGLLEVEALQPFQIVTNASSFPDAGEYVGLDARQSLPPLLRPGMLMDWESWWECERRAVQLLSAAPDVGTALGQLRGVVNALKSWNPRNGALVDRVTGAFAAQQDPVPAPDPRPLIDAVWRSVPHDWRPVETPTDIETNARVAVRFIAAHAFANWRVQQGEGLSDWLMSIETAAALLGAGYGVRRADLLLRHLTN